MKKMTKNTYSIDDKVEVARIIFTNIDMTTADLAEKAGIKKIDTNDNGFRVSFMEQPNIDPAKLIELIQTQSSVFQFNGTDTLRVANDMEDEDYSKRTAVITEVIKTLSIQ